MKITSLGGLCELFWQEQEEVLRMLRSKVGWLENDDRKRKLLHSPLDLAWTACLILRQGREHFSPYDSVMADCFLDDGTACSEESLQFNLKCLQDYFWVFRDEYRKVKFEMANPTKVLDNSITEFFDLRNLDQFSIQISHEDPTMWVYTQNLEHARADRQTRMRPGRLLKKLLPNEPDEVIQAVATVFTQGTRGLPLFIARTREEIRDVYENGPNSCMKHPAKNFNRIAEDTGDYVHPAEAYAGPDTAVAYVKGFAGEFKARGVIRTDNKSFGRLYGNITALTVALEAEGYSRVNDHMYGARLLRIELEGGGYACPYLDDASGIETISDKHLIAGCENFTYSEGAVGVEDDESLCECESCGDRFSNDVEGSFVDNYGDVCDSCLNSDGFVQAVCDRVGNEHQWARERDATYLECVEEWVMDSYVDRYCRHNNIVYSEYHDEYVKLDDCVRIGDEYVDTNREEVVCDVDDEYQFKADCAQLHDGSWILYGAMPLVELSRFSNETGLVLKTEARPALGADDCDWILQSDVIEYQGLEFYRRDCVWWTSPGWVPLIAMVSDANHGWIEAPLDSPYQQREEDRPGVPALPESVAPATIETEMEEVI